MVCEALGQCHQVGTCDPETGECSNPEASADTECDDGDPCTFEDRCASGGTCRGTTIVCDDEPGTCGGTRSCNGTATCAVEYPPATTECDDGEACTHTDHCDGAGSCVGTAIVCEDEPGCGLRRSCDGSDACVEAFAATGDPCDDEQLCTHTDLCQSDGTCDGTPIVCNNDPGTCGARRSCDGSDECVTVYPIGDDCNDEDACTPTSTCNGAGQCTGANAPTDGVFSWNFSDWGACSEICDGGIETRTATPECQEPTCGGSPCVVSPHGEELSRPCNENVQCTIVVMNEATNLTCREVCMDRGRTCTSIGSDTNATNLTWVGRQNDLGGCSFAAATSASSGCGLEMTDFGYSSSYRCPGSNGEETPTWTRCQCTLED